MFDTTFAITRSMRAIAIVAQWTPRVVYLGIVLPIAYRVVAFWMGYFQQIQNVIGF